MKPKKGFALIFTLIISLIIIAIIISLTAIAAGDLALANRTANTMRAYYLAEAGLARKFAERSGTGEILLNPINGQIVFFAGNSGTFVANAQQVGGGAFPTYTLTSIGTYKNVNKTLILTVRYISYSKYIYMTDLETRSGTRIWFIGGDIIRGPVHTNGQLNIFNDPTFEGPVSSVSSSINYYHGPPPLDNPDFQESLTLGAPNIKLPTAADILNGISIAAYDADPQHLYYFNGDTAITLFSNGTMNVTSPDRHWINHNMPLPPSSAIFVNGGYLNISGILSGQLTVGTNNNIYIVDNLLYANDPRTNPTSNDMLGLVSQNNVIIDSGAPNNLEIDGYIIALNKSFYLENYTSVLKGTLTLYGGITQVERGAVGTFNPDTGQKASGYTKDYNYDQRFENVAPAYFPPARDANGRIVYSKTLWQEL